MKVHQHIHAEPNECIKAEAYRTWMSIRWTEGDLENGVLHIHGLGKDRAKRLAEAWNAAWPDPIVQDDLDACQCTEHRIAAE